MGRYRRYIHRSRHRRPCCSARMRRSASSPCRISPAKPAGLRAHPLRARARHRRNPLQSLHARPRCDEAVRCRTPTGRRCCRSSGCTSSCSSASLWRLGPSFGEILLEQPYVRAVIRARRRDESRRPRQGFAAAPAKPQQPSAPLRLYIGRLAVISGTAYFEDRTRPTPFRAEFKPIALRAARLQHHRQDRGRLRAERRLARGRAAHLERHAAP